MRVTINRFTILVPNKMVGYILRKSFEKQDLYPDKSRSEIKEIVKEFQREILNYKKRNGSFVLLYVKDTDGSRFKVVI